MKNVIKVINPTTGEILFQSKDNVNITIMIGDRNRAVLTANKDSITVYLRDLIRDRPEIKLLRQRFGIWARMEV